jgi:hypothetical protein
MPATSEIIRREAREYDKGIFAYAARERQLINELRYQERHGEAIIIQAAMENEIKRRCHILRVLEEAAAYFEEKERGA